MSEYKPETILRPPWTLIFTYFSRPAVSPGPIFTDALRANEVQKAIYCDDESDDAPFVGFVHFEKATSSEKRPMRRDLSVAMKCNDARNLTAKSIRGWRLEANLNKDRKRGGERAVSFVCSFGRLDSIPAQNFLRDEETFLRQNYIGRRETSDENTPRLASHSPAKDSQCTDCQRGKNVNGKSLPYNLNFDSTQRYNHCTLQVKPSCPQNF